MYLLTFQTDNKRCARSVHPFLVSIALALFLAGCYSPSQYKGDGIMRKPGRFLEYHRYTIDLGVIDLNQRQQKTFYLSGLPNYHMGVGFEIHCSQWTLDDSVREVHPNNAVIRIHVDDAMHNPVVKVQDSLDHWTWSGDLHDKDDAFVYYGGKMREIKLQNGGSRSVREAEMTDHGFGSLFMPVTIKQYTLNMEIIEPNTKNDKCQATLIVAGGGK